MGKKVKKGEFVPLSNIEIDRFMRQRMGFGYNGCYARDEIPLLLQDGMYVVNLDGMNGPGTHWVGMHVAPSEIIYFDSFGFICPNEIVNRKNGRIIWYSTHEIQNTTSTACGYYVLYFLSQLFEGRDKNNILFDFSNSGSSANDLVLKNLLLIK